MRKLAILAAAVCMLASAETPARARSSDVLAQSREEREKAGQEREEARKRLERELRESRRHLEREREEARDTLREIRIRNSGKNSKDVIILTYGKDGRDLISVIDKGKIVSREDFPTYRLRLDEALGAREIDEIRPHLEELERIIESRRRTDEEKIEALKEVMEELKNRETETAARARDLYIAQLGALDAKRLALDHWTVVDSKNHLTIRIRKDGCYLNGKKLPDDLCERLLEIRDASRRLPEDEGEWREFEERDR